MIFLPPVGRQPSVANEAGEEFGFKAGDLLEGRVVRRVGDRYLFVDIGRQLRVKVHWELPFEVKPGEILNFEVVSEDPPTFRLVEPGRSPSFTTPTDATEPREEVPRERVEISSQGGRKEPTPRVTYGPLLKAKVVVRDPGQRDASASPSSEPLQEQVEEQDGVPLRRDVTRGERVADPPRGRTVSRSPLDSQAMRGLSALFEGTELSDSVFSLIKEEPFFSLYGEGMEEGVFEQGEGEGVRQLLLDGVGEEHLGQLKGLFQTPGSKVSELLRFIQELFYTDALDDAQATEIPKGAREGRSLAGPLRETPQVEDLPSSVSATPSKAKIAPGPAERLSTGIPPDTAEGLEDAPARSEEGGAVKGETKVSSEVASSSVAEVESEEVSFRRGGDRLAIRIWPAASRFTIESSTPPPPGLELDVGDMLQGKVVEVDGNKVIIDFGRFETQANWEAAHTVKPGASIKVMVASLLPQLRLRLVDEASFKGFTAKLGSMKGWGELFSKLQGAIEHLPLVKADKGEGVLLRTLKGFLANCGLSTEARMAKVVEGELPPDELKNDLKLQLARFISTGGEKAQLDAAKELMQSINGHQLLNVQTHDSGFLVIPLVVAYHNRVDEWRMTVSEEEAEGERWFRITLLSSPPGIGTIRIDLSYAQKARRLDMLFWVEKEESKEVVEKALPLLKEEFVESKVNLTRIEVGVSKGLSKEDLPIEVKRPFLLQTKA